MKAVAKKAMTGDNVESWDFYFGRGRGKNTSHKISKVTSLLKELAPRYSACGQTEKRIFVKQEVYDTVIKNGGAFYFIENQEVINVTTDIDELIKRIMQCFRDLNKLTKNSWSPSPSASPSSSVQGNAVKKVRKPRLTVMPSVAPLSRPKRTCVKESIIDIPAMECVRQALKAAKIEKVHLESNHNSSKRSEDLPPRILKETSAAQQTPNNDDFDSMAVEPPQLEESISALIMADDIITDLPTGSQKNVNQNLHTRVQRLENLVDILMSQKDDTLNAGLLL